jgi:hypothetical protein
VPYQIPLVGLLFTTTVVILGSLVAAFSCPMGWSMLVRKQRQADVEPTVSEDNDLTSGRHFVQLLIVGVGFVLLMSAILAIFAYPQLLKPFGLIVQPLVDVLEGWLKGLDPRIPLVVVMVIIVLPWVLSLRQEIPGIKPMWHYAAIIVAFVKLALALSVIALLYDAVHVFGTGFMERAITNTVGGSNMGTATGVRPLTFPFVLKFPGDWAWYPDSYTLLGLGDVLVSLLLATNAARMARRANNRLLYLAALGGFVLALCICVVVMMLFSFGQPALIYIVPCMTGAVWATAVATGNKQELLRKPFSTDQTLVGIRPQKTEVPPV